MDEFFGRPRKDDDHRVSPADLLGLPADQLKVMRVMLRYNELSYAMLVDGFARLPEGERLDQAALDTALLALSASNWLNRVDDDRGTVFRIGIIDRTFALNEDIQKEKSVPKASGLSDDPERTRPSRTRSGMDRLNNFWNKVAPTSGAETKKEEKPAKRSSLFEELSGGSAAPKPPRGSLFEELSGGKTAIKPTEPPKEPKQEGWISSLFDELAVKPRAQKAADDAADEKNSSTS